MSEGQIVRDIILRWNNAAENLLQILVDTQAAFNWIPDQARQIIADQLPINPAEIQRNLDFYAFLHEQPRGTYEVLFSDNIVDQMQGSRRLCEQLAERLDVGVNSTRIDGRVSLGYTSCTGMSDQGPAALVNGLAMANLTDDKIAQLARLIQDNIPLDQWPADWFRIKPGIQRKDLLLKNAVVPGIGIKKVLQTGADSVLGELLSSSLRGRGGAGFGTADKWRLCRDAGASDKIVVCNADEGEPGTFKDRLLLQSYADGVIEGMTVCAAVIGASKGFIYLRAEYLYLRSHLNQILQSRRDAGLLGKNILYHQNFDFDIQIHLGAGAYICGEESALIESLEGKPGIPRVRPPFPVTHGYQGLPTVVNNVETFFAASVITELGADAFNTLGTADSTGTKLLSVSGDCTRPGVYEYPFGVSMAQVLQDCGALDTQMVQLSGPAGQCLQTDEFQRRIAFEDLSTGGSCMIFDHSRDPLQIVQNFSHFFCHESCGFCTPCRVGTALLKKHLDTIVDGLGSQADLDSIGEIGTLMRNTSHCGLGHTAANPLLQSMQKFALIYRDKLKSTGADPGFDLSAALRTEGTEISND